MDDDRLKALLEAMELRLMSRIADQTAAVMTMITSLTDDQAAMEGRLMALMNTQHERLLDRLTAIEGDFQNTKGFLVEDAIISGRRWMSLEARVSRIERGGKEAP